jgi:hypothetical protein
MLAVHFIPSLYKYPRDASLCIPSALMGILLSSLTFVTRFLAALAPSRHWLAPRLGMLLGLCGGWLVGSLGRLAELEKAGLGWFVTVRHGLAQALWRQSG